jgi:hypothetical protein
VAVYRQIYITFWQDQFVLDLTPEEKYFYIYLMTNSKTTQCGCYEMPKKIMELETGYNRETVDKLLGRFIDYGKIEYDDTTGEVLLLNWLKYNPINNINIEKCVNKELLLIKSSDLSNTLEGLIRGYHTPTKKKEKEEEEKKEKEEVPPKPNKPQKIKLAEYVSMTKEQHEKLINDYGETATAGFIQILDNYKGAKGKTYKDDYRAILSWVIDSYKEKHGNEPARRTEEIKVECPVCREKVLEKDITAYENYACCKKCAEEGFNVKQAVF